MKNKKFCSRVWLQVSAGMMLALILVLGRIQPVKDLGYDTSSNRPVMDLTAPLVTSPRRRLGGRRTEAQEEQRRQEENTAREIDRLAAEFHGRLPFEQAQSVGAIYARYSTKFQHSITDQVRSLLEAALREGIFVPREHIFFDQGVRGCRERRPGLDGLRGVLKSGKVQTLLVFTTNRLFRKTYKALQFVEEEVVGSGIRCLFPKSGVDSADEKRWRMLLQFHAMTDEFVSGMYNDNIRAAQEGLFDKKLVCGTVTFGYRGREVAGAPTRKKGPRREYEIDPVAAEWVRRVFDWYVREEWSLVSILRRLNNDPAVPLGPRSDSGRWTRLALQHLLTNPRYRGLWQYGCTKNTWRPKKDYSRQLPREKPLRERQYEELRIVSDEVWFGAQRRLAAEPKFGGRRPKDGNQKSRPKLLNGLFFCGVHGCRMHVGGISGLMMVCPVCRDLPADKRPLFTTLNRVQALRLTCRRLAEVICPDEDLVAQIRTACEAEVLRQQRPDPARLEEARARHAKFSQQIQFLLDNAGDCEADRREAEVSLRRLRTERAKIAEEIAVLEAAALRPALRPSVEDVTRMLSDMGEILVAAGQSEREEDVSAVRRVVTLLTGGRIEMFQQGEARSHGGWLQGRFRLQVVTQGVAQIMGLPGSEAEGDREVVIDYREPTPAERWAEQVKERYDAGLLIKAIAAELGIRPNLVRRALDCSCRNHGQELPDGRLRRSTLRVQHLQPPRYQEMADRVMELYQQGVLLQDIAAQMACNRATVSMAKEYWHAARGLPVQDGRTRLKDLAQSSRPRPDTQKEGLDPK